MKWGVSMKKQDTYKEVRIFEFPGMVARVYIPDLTPEERNRRMKAIYKEAANLLKVAEGCETYGSR